MSAKTIFITGSSGVGKTPLVGILKSILSDSFDVHDFDEKLAGAEHTKENWLSDWRKKTTQYFLGVSVHNAEENRTTIICGLTFPQEIFNSPNFKLAPPTTVYFLDASDEALRHRFYQRRFSDENKITALKADTGLTPEEFIEQNKKDVALLKQECVGYGAEVIDTSNMNSEQVATKIKDRIEEFST